MGYPPPAYCTNASSNSSSHGNDTDILTENSNLPAVMVLAALIAACLSSLIGLFNVYKHLRNYTRPEYQRSLIRILLIVPLYASFSWLSLALPSEALIFESIRDIWEAVVINEFLKLVLAYCGGESNCLLVIMKKPGSIEHMWPFNYCLPRLRLDARFMRLCKRFTLQFVFIKPIMAIANIAMYETCQYSNSTFQLLELIIYNLSYCIALYGLVLFYLATHHHPGLMSRKPLLKFLAIKTVIFATYYQTLLVQLIPGYSLEYLATLNNFIFCFEMIFFACLHIWAFGWFEFAGGNAPGIGDPENPLESGIPGAGLGGTHSLALNHDEYDNPSSMHKDNLQGNVKDVLNMEDVVIDAMENFNTKYEHHVKLDTSSKNNGIEMMEDEDENSNNPFQQLSTSSTSTIPTHVTGRSAKVEPGDISNDRAKGNTPRPQQNHPPTSSLSTTTEPAQPTANPFSNPFEEDYT